MLQEKQQIIRFSNPAAATRQARSLGVLDSFSEVSKLLEADEVLLGGYEQQDSRYLLIWVDSLDTFEVVRANVLKVVGYYALTREVAAELAPELKDVPNFLANAPAKAPPAKKQTRKRANPRVEQTKQGAQKNVEAEPSNAFTWEQVEAEFELFHSVTASLRRAGGYCDVIEPGLLLLAIAEQGRMQGEVQWAADFLLRELHGAGSTRYQQVRADYLRSRGYAADPREGQTPSLSKPLFETMLRTREIEEATTGAGPIHVRHLVAALLHDAQPGPDSVLEVLTPLGVDVIRLRERMLGWVVGYGDDDREWERLLSSGAREQRLVAYHADDPKGQDFIDISRDVIALATLIAARDIRPPLSVGLFGDWGSGKTFFMRQLRGAIATLSRDARESGRMQRELPFYKRIVQIEFNAWHYVEGNLWASLVEHIFSNLRIADDDEDSVTEHLQKDLLAKIGFQTAALAAATQQEQQAVAAVADAQRELQDAERRRDEKRRELSELKGRNIKRLFDLPAIQQQLQPLLAALGLAAVSTAATDIDHALKRAETVLQQGGGVLSPLFHARDRGLRWAKLAAAVLVPAALGLTVTWLVRNVNFAPIASLFATLAALGGSLTRWLNRQTQWVNEKVQKLHAIQRDYDARLAELMQENDQEVTALQLQLRDLSAERDVKLQNKLEAQKTLETVQTELKNATSARLLADFIMDRAESSDYRKHLGLLALVRDDFEKLSGLIDEENWKLAPTIPGERPRSALRKFESLEEEDAEAPSRINRIVLYIDDLDRCPPNKVVEVLQAVHLLLAFPLFVVVVGVDARWVKRSLRSRYKELLHSSALRDDEDEVELIGRATADDYLEKIFQVPFWLEPMDVTGCRRMVNGLLRSSVHTNGAEQQNKRAAPALDVASQPKRETVEKRETIEKRAPVTMKPAAAPSAAAPEDSAPRTPAEANIESLQILPAELQFMNELAPVLGRSPRALKRFVNVYRLLKAELSTPEHDAFLDPEHGAYRIALFLLAVDTGTPLALAQVHTAIAQQRTEPATDDAGWLISVLEMAGTSENGSRFDTERARLNDWIKERRHEPFLAKADLMDRWSERIARYSFGAHALEALRTAGVQLTPNAERNNH